MFQANPTAGEKFFVLLLRGAEIAAVDWRQVCRLVEVVVEDVALVLPPEAEVERQVVGRLPAVLHVEVVPVVGACVIQPV